MELLVTLDDPEGAPEEDTFHHHPAENAPSLGSVRRSQQNGSPTNEQKPLVKTMK